MLLRAGLLPGAEVGRAAARLGALAALGSAQGFPCTGEFRGRPPHSSAKHPLQCPCKPKSQPRISPYKGPRISVLLAHHDRGVRVSGSMVLPSTPCAPFLKSHANVFSEVFLSAHLRGLGPVTSRRSKTGASFKALPSSMGFTENPKCHSGFLGSQTGEGKKVLLEAVWV